MTGGSPQPCRMHRDVLISFASWALRTCFLFEDLICFLYLFVFSVFMFCFSLA